MKVFHIVPQSEKKVGEAFLHVLKDGLRGEGIDVSWEFVPLKRPFDLRLAFRLAKAARSRGAGCLHTHGEAAIVVGAVAGFLSGCPVVHSFHARTTKIGHPFFLRRAKSVVLNSEYVRRYLTKYNRISRKRLTTIYPGVRFNGSQKTPADRKALKKSFGLTPEEFVIGYVADMVRENDHETLLKAFRKMMKKKAGARLLFIGEGPHQKNIEEKISGFGLEGRVSIIAPKDYDDNVFKIMDCYVHSGFREGFHSPILKAMSHGIPVIATKIGDHPEYIDEGKTGYLVPCGFPERIESALMRMYVNRKLADELGKNAREKAKGRFGFGRMIGEYRDLYNSVGSGR